MGAALPILDLARFDAGEAERKTFLDDLRAAARTVGFFYLVARDVPETRIAAVQALARRFFALPVDEKRAVAMVHSPHFRGYTEAGAEITRGRADWREQFDIGAERPALPREPGAPAWTRLQGPNLWPAALPELRPALLAWQEAVTGIGIRLLEAFALALGQPAEAFAPI